MCGIAGLVDFDGADAPESLVRAMCTAMCHRGPDDEGVMAIPRLPSREPSRAPCSATAA